MLSKFGLFSKIFGLLLLGSLVFGGYQTWRLRSKHQDLADAREVIQDLNRWQGAMVQTIRLASGNNEVTKDTAANQVQAMGQSLVTMHQAVQEQNQAIEELAARYTEAQRIAERERRARQNAIRTAEQLRDQLRNRALSPVPIEEMEAEVRRTQDLLYENGL